MNENKLSFKKEDGKCVFILESKDILRKEYVSVEFARSHYTELIQQKKQTMDNLGAINRELKEVSVEKDKELEKFIEMANKAHKYHKMQEAEQKKAAAQEMLEKIELSMKNIENVLPEVKRTKK
jgi:hypothetical protein